MREVERGTCILHANCRGVDRRVMGSCRKCGREVSMSAGHLAPTPVERHSLVCGRCIGRV